MSTTLRIGVRDGKPGLWQAEYTRRQLQAAGFHAELVAIKTQEGRLGFDKAESRGFFTRAIEEALLNGEIDLAVHSMKGLPARSPEGLSITAVSCREDPADWLLARRERLEEGLLFQLPRGAVVGASSARRKAQMLDFRPDAEIRDIRGNVPARLAMLREGQFDAILLAAASLTRLEINLSEFHVVRFNPREFVPAPAQGVLAWQARSDDKDTRRALKHIHHPEVSAVVNVERRVLNLLDGGRQTPLGAYCEQDGAGNYHVWAAKADAWNAPVKRVRLSQSTRHMLAERVVEALKA